jgi:hypothetical protein
MNFLLALSALALLNFVRGQDQPEITQIILPEVKMIGMTGYLNCTVSRQGDNKVFWIHKGMNMILTSDNRVEVDESINAVVDGLTKYDVARRVSGNQHTYMLVVRRLVLTDAGNYTCQVNVKGYNIQPSKDGIIVVMMPPYIIQGQTTQTITVTEGGAVNLTCAAHGYPMPNISWVRVNGNTLPPPYNRFAFKGTKLPLTNIRPIDRGMYRCVADNNVRPLATYDTTVYVNFRPAVRAVQSSYGQAQNRLFDLIIECIVAGYPTPDMKWYKQVQGQTPTEVITDDKHVVNQLLSHGQQLSISEVWYQLIIINVQGNDYGHYTCQGTNKLGVGNFSIQVYETSECQGANCPPEGGTTTGADRTLPALSLSLLLALCTAWAIKS